MALFSDISTDTLALVTDLDAIRQRIENVLLTSKHERLFRPDFGASLEDIIFELDPYMVETLLYHNIAVAFATDPEVTFEIGDSEITYSDEEPNKIYVSAIFSVRSIANGTINYNAIISR